MPELNKMFSAAILNGGKNSRMKGFSKSNIIIGDFSILERQILVLKPIFTSLILIGAKNELFTDLPSFNDIYNSKGPLSGIHSALLNSKTDYVFVVSCDMPFINGELIKEMLEFTLKSKAEIIVPKHIEGIEPLFSVYSKKTILRIEKMLLSKELSVRNLFKTINTQYFEVNNSYIANKVFFNVNTPNDIEIARNYANKT